MTAVKKVKRQCSVCKRTFIPSHDSAKVTQRVCSFKCCVDYYDKLKKKGRGPARETARMMGRRSMGEIRFEAKWFEGKSIKATYETDTFKYEVHETKRYTIDWTIKRRGANEFYLEYKGNLDGRSRKILKLMKNQHPDLDIRLVFERPENKISPNSKTTYALWAEQYGFPWVGLDSKELEEWLT